MRTCIDILAGGALAVACSAVQAGAFSSESYSSASIGNAYAGSATGAHDNSDSFFNAAAMIRNERPQLTLGVVAVDSNLTARIASTQVNGISQRGNSSATPGRVSLLPNISVTWPVSDRLSLGLNVSSPFDLNTSYERDSLARFHALDSRIKSTNINPMIAYKISRDTSIGFGIQHERLDVELLRNIAPSGVLGAYDGSSTTYGFNLGLLSQVSPDLRLGVGYRSPLKHKLDGTVGLISPVGVTLPGYQGTVDFAMPAMLTMGMSYQASPRTELLADVRWTRWSSISQFLIERVNPPPGNTNVAVLLPLRDRLMTSVGINFMLDEKWMLRSGFAYEKDAFTDHYRNPRFPGGDRFWLGLGMRYRIDERTYVNLSYARQIVKDTVGRIPESTATASIDAAYKQSVNLFGLSVNFGW